MSNHAPGQEKCSLCDKYFSEPDEQGSRFYCPHCGADLDATTEDLNAWFEDEFGSLDFDEDEI